MLKNFPFKTVILTLVAWMVFWEIKETITGDRLLFFVRWICSDMGYSKKIEVLTYLLTDEQVSTMLLHPDEKIHQLTNRELSETNVNVVLRIRNLTSGHALGRLFWTIHGTSWSVVDVDYIPDPESPQKYCDIIIPMGFLAYPHDDALPDPIITKWDSLYVSR